MAVFYSGPFQGSAGTMTAAGMRNANVNASATNISIFLKVIWLLQGQLWATAKDVASLIRCLSLHIADLTKMSLGTS